MKKLALISLFLAQSVSANEWDNPYTPFSTEKNKHTKITLTWRAVDNVAEACYAEHKKRGFWDMKNYPAVDACSFWEDEKCLIITKKRPTMHDVGHEIRHCFQGKWH